MATVFLPPQLRDLTDGQARIEVEARSVRDVVNELERRHPGIRQRLCVGNRLAAELQISVDDVMTSEGLDAAVGPQSEIHILPALGGG